MTNSTDNQNAIKSNWSEQKTKLKTKFPTLTDDDLKYDEGKKEEMLSKIQVKLGKSKEEFATIIASL